MLQSHSPAMLPSPARLGVQQPPPSAAAAITSPSLPSPSNATTTTTASKPASSQPPPSSALLPLLPPLPRAQSLLHQMSSLASRLFEVSPHRSHWLAAFRGSLPSFLRSSSSTSLPFSLPNTTKEVISQFTSLQTMLFESVAELQEILDLQDSRNKVALDCNAADSSLRNFSNSLRDAVQLLDSLLDDYSDYLRPLKRSKSESEGSESSSYSLRSSLDVSEILAYAHRISYTTFAPPEHGAGLAPLRGALPPAPQENEMRASQLYHFADLDVGMPRKGTEVKDKTAGNATAEELRLIEPTPPREELPAPPMLPISVPPGWRKGMPVELPVDLPPIPPGWKPGDPIPLPPLDLQAGRGEELRLPVRPVQPKAPGPIQVKYVQLDINPNEDDYSSDYSSDEGSSDEDDED